MKSRALRAALLSGAALVLVGLTELSAQVPAALPQQGGAVQPRPIQPGGPAVQPGGRPIGISPGVGNMYARPVMTSLDVNKDGKVTKEEFMAAAEKFFKDCDTANTGKINEKAIADQLNKVLPQQPKIRPGGPIIRPVGPGQPGNPGAQPGNPGAVPPRNPGVRPLPPQPANPPAIQPAPGQPAIQPAPGQPAIQPGAIGRPQPTVVRLGVGPMLARGIVKRTGTDKENNVTLDKFKVAAAGLFQEIDKDKNGSLDEKEIAAGINLLMPFGGGGVGGGIAVPPGIPAPPGIAVPPGVAPQPGIAVPRKQN